MTSWWIALLASGTLVSGYLVAWWRRPSTLPPWSRWRTLAWCAGAITVAVALSPPLTALAHHDHRYHMAQHLLLGMYAPIGLVLGAPFTLGVGSVSVRARRVSSRILRTRILRLMTHPVTAAVLNVGGMFVLYLTPLYAASMASDLLHGLGMAHFLVAGYLYTSAIAGPDPAPRRPRMTTRLSVLVLAAGAHAFLAKYLYANAAALGAGHQHGAGHPAPLPQEHTTAMMEDAAIWMYYGGDIAEIALAVMLFAWWSRHRPRLGRRQARPATSRSAQGSARAG